MISLGICTHNRPAFFAKTCRAVARNLTVDRVYVHNDGSHPKHQWGYRQAYRHLPGAVLQVDPRNKGVARAKNALLTQMLEDGADWLFLLEDDILPLDQQAITGYLEACELSGWQHLSFAHHGPGNTGGPIEVDGPVSLYPHYIGAWCVYSRECLQAVGLFDENLRNCWEHVEHTLRLAQAGFTDPRPWHAADATGSQEWLMEQPDSIRRSSILLKPDHQRNIQAGLAYWAQAKPETFSRLWPDLTPVT